MLRTILTDDYREPFKTCGDLIDEKLGKCLICEDRVRKNQNYLTTAEGYVHGNCLQQWKAGDLDV